MRPRDLYGCWLAMRHPGYQELMNSPDYRAWLAMQQIGVQLLDNSTHPRDALRVIALYKSYRKRLKEAPMTPKDPNKMTEAEIADFCESYWLKDAKKSLIQRDPLDAIRDAEALLRFVVDHFDEAIDQACIDNLLHSDLMARADARNAMQRLGGGGHVYDAPNRLFKGTDR